MLDTKKADIEWKCEFVDELNRLGYSMNNINRFISFVKSEYHSKYKGILGQTDNDKEQNEWKSQEYTTQIEIKEMIILREMIIHPRRIE